MNRKPFKIAPLSVHFMNKYYKRKVNADAVIELKKDYEEVKAIPHKSVADIDIMNWLYSLRIRAEGVIKHGLKLKVVPQ